jgi:hypothetical protein
MLDIVNGIQTSVGNSNQQALNTTNDTQGYLNNTVATLVTPNNMQGIAGWLFDVKKTDQLDLDSDITDHYMEDNSFVNDHVVIKPIIIQQSGFIGELKALKPSGSDQAFEFLKSDLQALDSFAGEYTGQTLQKMQDVISQAQSYTNAVNQTISQTKNIVKQFDGISGNNTEQENAYKKLSSLFKSANLVTVQTPWGIIENMKIQKVSLSQPEDSVDYSDISLTLKEMRFTQVKTTVFDSTNYNRNSMQNSDTKDLGKTKGTKLVSFVKDIYNNVGK